MRSQIRTGQAAWGLALLLGCCTLVACGGGSTDPIVPDGLPPTVVQFSPPYAPYDFGTGDQAAVFTNPDLTVGTDPAFPGQIVVFFRTDAALDESSFYVGGNPSLGPDNDAVQLLYLVAGSGWVPVVTTLTVGADHLAFTPGASFTPLRVGSYRIEVGTVGLDVEGLAVAPAPVFHAFYVTTDVDAPHAVATSPAPDTLDVPHGPASPDIVIRFGESILSSSVTGLTIEVFDVTAIVSTTQLAPAAGYPRLQVEDDAATLPSNGHVVVWRAQGGFPPDAILRVRVRGVAGGMSPQVIEDLNANEMVDDYTYRLFTAP